jgi:hypothetical protein
MIVVDFNELEEGGRIVAFVSDSTELLVPGRETILADDLGNVCVALVEAVISDEAHLRVDWSTWNKQLVLAVNGITKAAHFRPTPDAPRTGSAKTPTSI